MSAVTVTADIVDPGGEISPPRVNFSAVTGMAGKFQPQKSSASALRHGPGDVLEPVG